MWARITELLLGVWLAISPYVFRYEDGIDTLWLTTWVASALVVMAALASWHPRLGKAHLLELGVAAWLLALAFIQPVSPPPIAYQNLACVALLLLMFAIIPSHASRPPRAWTEFYKNRGRP